MIPLPVDLVVKASALIAIAGLAQAALRRHGSAAGRHMVWTIAVVGLLALPVASIALPHWQLAIPVAAPVTAVPPPATFAQSGMTHPSHAPSSAVERMPVAPAAAGVPWTSVVASIYSLGVLLLLGRLAIEPRALRRLLRASHPIAGDGWSRDVALAASHVGLTRPARVCLSRDEVMPMTFGIRRPVVLLPAAAVCWSHERRRAVLLHELAHVARGDCLTQVLAGIACAFYWPHPGVWWAAHRLRVERELACDDRVLAAGTDADDYASHLLEIARSLGRRPAPAIALGMARARQLEDRLLAVLDAARNRAGLAPRGRVVAALVALVTLLPIVIVRAAVVPSGPASTASAQAGPKGASQQPAPPQSEAAGAWTLRLSGNGAVSLNLRTLHSSNGMTIALSRLDGLTAAQIAGQAETVRFASRRDAGTLTFTGVCHTGLCGGTYSFEPNAAFAADLEKRGIGRPSADEQLALAIEDVGTSFLDALEAERYKTPDVHLLVRAAQHGVDETYVRSMGSLGYRLGAVDELIRLRDHGVDPEYAKGLGALGFTRVPADELLRSRDHGVDPAYVKGLRDLGFGSLTLDELVKARDHGVDPEYVRGMQALGQRGSIDDWIRARDHGVDPEYIRGLASLGYREMTMDALIRTRDHGVDPEYVRGLAELGYRNIATDTLIRMRDHGVDPAYVRQLRDRGITNLTVDQLIERRDRGEDDPAAAARAVMEQVRTAFRSMLRWWQQA